MATVTLSNPPSPLPLLRGRDDRHGWGFALLLAVVATLFLRPADIVPALDDWPVYQFMIVSCLVVAARPTFRLLAQRQLADQPVLGCLLLLLAAVAMSHLSHGFFWAARMSVFEFAKVLIFYLLIVGLVNTPQRLVMFVQWLIFAITLIASLAILDRYDIVSIAALESVKDHGAEQTVLIDRIRGTGIFQDPNDFGLMLVTGIVLSCAFLLRPRAGWPRYLWLAPCGILLAALAMTHSRGAFLSLACAFPAAFAYRRGWKVGAVSLVGLPLLALLFSARMTDMSSMSAGTGQSRIQIWSESLMIFRNYPVFGLGEGLLADEIGVVTHNSFLHCFAELGLFGGATFLGCFLAAHLGLWEVRYKKLEPQADLGAIESRSMHRSHAISLTHLRVYIFAALAAYTAGILTISRQFVTPTYLILGLATATYVLHGHAPGRWRLDNRFWGLLGAACIASLVVFYAAVRLLVRW